MRRLRPISRSPEHGASVAPEVKLTIIVKFIDAFQTKMGYETSTT
ncbi:MAG TPA: hypothetical protein PLI09_20695 [Candidatus Hydrogenedentes bacterium]|nr:hypothetical protein [Candidatus Hydrogenedentota bacterium]